MWGICLVQVTFEPSKSSTILTLTRDLGLTFGGMGRGGEAWLALQGAFVFFRTLMYITWHIFLVAVQLLISRQGAILQLSGGVLIVLLISKGREFVSHTSMSSVHSTPGK